MRHQIALSLLCLLAVAGCSRLPAQADLQPWIAVTGRYALACDPAVPPAPLPTPDSDKCDTCGGKGFLGDVSQTRLTCTDCNGTGRKTKSVILVPTAPAAAALNCKDGRCTTRVIVR